MAQADVQRVRAISLSGGAADARQRTAASALLGVLAGCGLMALAAQVRIPLPGTDVPMTLQSLALVLVGLTLPARTAVFAMILYAGLGAAGFPVFAPGSLGLAGPTGGYIAGFAPAAGLIAVVRGCASNAPRLVLAGGAGLVLLFVIGVAWRTVWLGGDFVLALSTGFLPFAGKAAVELVLAAMLVAAFRRSRRG